MNEDAEMLRFMAGTGIVHHSAREEGPVQRREREGKQCDGGGEEAKLIEVCLWMRHTSDQVDHSAAGRRLPQGSFATACLRRDRDRDYGQGLYGRALGLNNGCSRDREWMFEKKKKNQEEAWKDLEYTGE